jgi:hypothetical protein
MSVVDAQRIEKNGWEIVGKWLGHLTRMLFWLIGWCGLVSIVLGISEDNVTLIAGGLLMLCAASGGEITNRKTNQ